MITSVLCFYWLTRTLIPGVIYTKILNIIDFNKSRDIENRLVENRNIFINKLKNFKRIKTLDEDPVELISRNPYRIFTSS